MIDDECLIGVKRCGRCRGRGDLPCPDPQCGDSTWDHACEEGTVCSDCAGRGFKVSLVDERRPSGALEKWGGSRPTGVAEAVAKMVEYRVDGWRDRAKEVAPLLLVLERLNDDRQRAAMLGVQAIAGLVHMAKPLLDSPEWRSLIEEVRAEGEQDGRDDEG